MRAFLAALMKEGVISIIVLILLCLLVWFGGEYLKTEDNDLFKERILIIAILIGIFLILFVVQKVLAVRSAVRIEQQLKAQSGSQLEGADADKKAEIESLSKTFNESLEALKKTKGGKSALFTLPWYIIIGPPGSGKTTALQESGLNFPAVQGGAKVRGIGGTRNCDWWFTEDGILLDTAGRYTTVAEDQEEWFAFLEMIRTSRKDKPINGAIVAIAIDELFRATANEMDQMAKDVRNRLDELAARLQAVFPVYMMFTKCDLIQGFAEFYEDFNKEQRGQVWGFTFPYSLPDKQYTEIFSDQVAAMGGNIQARQLELLATERPPQKKQNIYLFPRQFALASEKMKEFLGSLFHANAFQESAVLRGIYFTSGTQKGTPIDQILARMGEAMGMGPTHDGSDERVEKKSYFIHNLFTKVIFHDKTLARSSSKVIRKRRAVRLTLQITSLVALALMSWVLVSSFYGNHEIINNIEEAGVPVRDLTPDDQPSLEQLQTLDKLRKQLGQLENFKEEGRPVRLSFGMYQGDRMFDSGADVYFQRLRPMYIGPSGKRVEAELRKLLAKGGDFTSTEYERLLELWRVYRMLSGTLPAKPDMVSVIMKKNGRWTGELAGKNADEIEALAGEQLEFYAAQLAKADKTADKYGLFIGLDAQLDKRASDKLQNGLWPVAAYETIIQHVSERRKALTLNELVPDNAAYLEMRTDGTDGTNLSRLNAFTQEAWDTEVKGLLDSRADDLADLYKELGINKDANQIRGELYARHKAKHLDVWNLVLKQVYPKPGMFLDNSNQDHVKKTNEALKKITGSDQSPIRELVQSVWSYRQLTLTPGDAIPGPDDGETKALDSAMGELSKFADAYNAFWTAKPQKGHRIMDHFDTPEPLDNLAGGFRTVWQTLPKPFPERDLEVSKFLLRTVEIGFRALNTESDAEIAWWWQDGVVKLWTTSFKGKYPFDPKAKEGVSMVNFARMFNPVDGVIWNTDKRLRSLEKISFHAGRKLVVLSNEYKATIDRASNIKDAMFATDTDSMVKVNFSVKLTQVGLLNGSLLEIGTDENGKYNELPWNKYPNQTRDFTWQQYSTGQSRMGARVTAFYTERKIKLPDKDLREKPWGLLRLMHGPYGTYSADASGDLPTYRVVWEFKSPDSQYFYLQAEISPQKKQNPFDESLFDGFAPTEKVSE